MFIVDFDTVCCSPQMPPHLVVGDHVYTHWLYISDTPEKNICFHASPFPPLPHTHTPFLSPRYTALQTFMVDLFMRWGSILALGLSLRWGSYCLFLLTAFVVFINITFWHSDIHALPEDRGKNKKKFSNSPKLAQYFIPTLTGRQWLFLLKWWQIWNFLLQCIFERPSVIFVFVVVFYQCVSWVYESELDWFGECLPQGWIYSVLV